MTIWLVFFLGIALGFFFITWPHMHVKKIGVDRQKNEELVTSGPYLLVRHPEYSGEIIFFSSGLFLTISTNRAPLILTIAICLVFIWYIWVLIKKSMREEAILKEKFGQKANDFFTKTRKRWIPFLI